VVADTSGVVWKECYLMQGSLARKLRVLRAERDWTLQDAAARMDMRPATLSDIEHGRSRPHDSTLKKLARAYDTSVEDLLEDVDPAELIARKKVLSVPEQLPITGSKPEEIDKLLRLGDRDAVGALLRDVDEELRGLEEIVDLRDRARLYQATILQRWLQVNDDRRSPESNRLKTVSDVANELGGKYKSLAGGEEASPEDSTRQKNTA
jgi:transcriptional regulator with XRE-family HTH domain